MRSPTPQIKAPLGARLWELQKWSQAIIETLLQLGCRSPATLAPKTKGRRDEKRTPTEVDALSMIQTGKGAYIFFSEHTFLAASQAPPAFSQSAAFFACVTSPANAGIAKPSARARASEERKSSWRLLLHKIARTQNNASSRRRFRRSLVHFREAKPTPARPRPSPRRTAH